MITVEEFGSLSTGQIVKKYCIKNSRGEYAEFLDYGAAIHSVHVLDKAGNLSDVVLGVAKASELEKNSFEGITIGRCANRIAYGKCVLDGKEVQLEQNLGEHFLHGASGNYGFRHFDAILHPEQDSVTFVCEDQGEGGFGCKVRAEITFSFDEKSRLTIRYHIVPEGTTVIRPTNHVYFNLSGKDVRDHRLTIRTDQVVNRREQGLPCDGTHSVSESPADFGKERTIRSAMQSDDGSYFPRKPERFDEFYVLPVHPADQWVARLSDNISGRSVEVYTDAESLIIFNAIAQTPVSGKHGKFYEG